MAIFHISYGFCAPKLSKSLHFWLNHYGMRGNASPVLTATGLVNGRWQFSTPTESTPLNQSPNNLAHAITSAAPTAAKFGANPPMVGFWANGWNITNFFIHTFFSGTHLQVRHVDGFSRSIAQTTRTRARVCLLGVSSILLPISGGGWNPKNNNFRGVNRLFQPKLAKYWEFHIIETTAWISTKFCTTIETTKWSSWVVQYAPNKSKMADSRPFENR